MVAGKDLDHLFLYYFLLSARDQLDALGSGTTFKELSATNLKSVAIPLPPLEEQKRIVAKLEQAFTALARATANAEANLADAREIWKTALALLYQQAGADNGWLCFDDLCAPVTPKAKVQKKNYLAAGMFPIVSQEADLVSGYWNNEADVMKFDEPVVVFGDHTCCLKLIDFDFVAGADGTKILRPKPGIYANYLYYGFRSHPVDETGYARHFRFLREKMLPRLALDDQHIIAERCRLIEDQIEALTTHYTAQRADLAALRQNLLHRAFTGQL